MAVVKVAVSTLTFRTSDSPLRNIALVPEQTLSIHDSDHSSPSAGRKLPATETKEVACGPGVPVADREAMS